MTELTALQRYKALQRDDSKLCAELKAQRTMVVEAIRKNESALVALEREQLEIEAAIYQLGGES